MEDIEKLKSYVYQQIQTGLNPNEISAQLRGAGWSEENITAAFKGVQEQMVPSSPGAVQPASAGQASPAKFEANGQRKGFFKRIKTSWILMKQSLRVLKNNKQLVRYPFIAGVINLVFLLAMCGVFFLGKDVLLTPTLNLQGQTEYNPTAFGFIVIVIYYVLSFFITFLYTAGLAAHTLDIFRGKSESYQHYMDVAWAKKGPIFVYSIITTTVGYILHLIEENRLLGLIVSRILGAIWKLANLFTIPVIVEEKIGAPAAIKKSGKLFISRWGENIAGRVGFGGLMFLLYLLIFIPIWFVLGLILFNLGAFGAILFLILFMLSLIALATIEVTASNILNTALYFYAKYEQVPAAFDADMLNATLVPKKKGLLSKKTPKPQP